MGKAPYKTVAEHNATEAKRQTLSTIEYGEAQHKLNPFLGDNETAKAEFVKRDPELAKFYQAEAVPVSIPVFGRKRNLTIQGRLYKDPSVAATYKIAEQIAQQWLASDKAAAEEQRKLAEAALAKLQSQIA